MTNLGAGVTLTGQVLQYPTCLIVASGTYARFYGVARGLATVELAALTTERTIWSPTTRASAP